MSKLKSVNQAENTEKENDIIELGEKLQDTFSAQETWSKEENILKEKINSLLRDIEEEKIKHENLQDEKNRIEMEKFDIIKSIENDSTQTKMEADLAEASRVRTELEV